MANVYTSSYTGEQIDAAVATTEALQTTVNNMISGTQTVGNATNAVNATTATNAASATNATNSTNATNDGLGNNIATTYATQSALSNEASTRQEADTTLQTNIDAKYTKPLAGIPESDLTLDVQQKLNSGGGGSSGYKWIKAEITDIAVSGGIATLKTNITQTQFTLATFIFVHCAPSLTVDGAAGSSMIDCSIPVMVNSIVPWSSSCTKQNEYAPIMMSGTSEATNSAPLAILGDINNSSSLLEVIMYFAFNPKILITDLYKTSTSVWVLLPSTE